MESDVASPDRHIADDQEDGTGRVEYGVQRGHAVQPEQPVDPAFDGSECVGVGAIVITANPSVVVDQPQLRAMVNLIAGFAIGLFGRTGTQLKAAVNQSV